MALAAFIFGAVLGSGSPAADTVGRFADAWVRQDFSAMHAELTDDAASRYPKKRFEQLYKEAETTATVSSLDHGDPDGPHSVSGGDAVTLPVTIRTNAFGDLGGHIDFPVDGDSIAWEPNLVFPGLARGDRLTRRTQLPKRGAILADDGTPLAEGSAAARSSSVDGAASVAGETGTPKAKQARQLARLGFPQGGSTGTTGLEKAFNVRLSGKPGGQLLATKGSSGGGRQLASSESVDGQPVHTTVDPHLQQAAVNALGSTYGGVAVLDAKTGAVRGVAGLAFSAPQPPGSTMKVVTTTAALDAGVVKLSDTFPVETSTTEIEGYELANAHDEPCGGTFVESFAKSCNTVFAPLGVDVGAEKLISTAEAFGFNSTPALFNEEATATIKPPESTIPTELPSDLDVGVSAIGQGKVLATPLELASISQTIAAGGTRSPTALVTDEGLGPDAKPVKVTSPQTAATVRDLMVQVVTSGTGVAAALPNVQVAGKTGTAELGPKPFSADEEQGGGEQKVDAWFTSFAPAGSPQLVVAVMVVNADGDGGTVAAPIAREVLASGLG
jgi:cell division protein FtsI/penicillin-binding protein 2